MYVFHSDFFCFLHSFAYYSQFCDIYCTYEKKVVITKFAKVAHTNPKITYDLRTTVDVRVSKWQSLHTQSYNTYNK
jgi:hypothetical protein